MTATTNETNEFKDLEQKLLGAYSTIFARSLAKKAADAIRQNAERIEYLEGYVEAQKESFDEIAQGNKELQAKLSRWESQKVVAWMYSDGLIYTLLPKFMQVLATPLIARLPDDEGEKE